MCVGVCVSARLSVCLCFVGGERGVGLESS